MEQVNEYECRELVLAVLERIESELIRVMENITQENYDSPFRNVGGNGFKNEVFEVRPYYWGDDEDEIAKPNFKWRDVELHWYKHCGRGLYANRIIYSEELDFMLEDCLWSIREMEKDDML